MRAFLQSIIPAPVRSRRALMVLGVISPPAGAAAAGASAAGSAGAAASTGAAASAGAAAPALRAARASAARPFLAARDALRAAWLAANSSTAALLAASLAILLAAP